MDAVFGAVASVFARKGYRVAQQWVANQANQYVRQSAERAFDYISNNLGRQGAIKYLANNVFNPTSFRSSVRYEKRLKVQRDECRRQRRSANL